MCRHAYISMIVLSLKYFTIYSAYGKRNDAEDVVPTSVRAAAAAPALGLQRAVPTTLPEGKKPPGFVLPIVHGDVAGEGGGCYGAKKRIQKGVARET